eukprot:scaffold203_cov386-Prasinococcus_capsulatus_cf.AAC.25
MENIVNSVMNGYGQESAFIVTCVSPVDANTKKRLCRIGELAQTMSTAVHQHAAQFVPSDRPSATQGAAGSEAVGKLPLEEFCTEDDLLKKGVRELKELLKAAQDARKASTFGTQEKHPPIEKKELVAAVHRVQQAGEAESICAVRRYIQGLGIACLSESLRWRLTVVDLSGRIQEWGYVTRSSLCPSIPLYLCRSLASEQESGVPPMQAWRPVRRSSNAHSLLGTRFKR